MADFWDTPQSYPKSWGPQERDFFDREPNTFRGLYDSKSEFSSVQRVFNKGWIARTSRRARDNARDSFYELTGTLKSSFDWEAYREYLAAVGSPTA